MKPILSSVLASLALLAAPVAAQGSILPYLPKDTIVAVAAPDLATTMAEFQQMPLAKMWAEQEVQTFVADLKAMVAKKLDEGMAQAKEMHAQGALPVDPEELLKLRLHGAAFALTHMEMAMGDRGPLPKFGLVLHLDFGPTAQQWHGLIQMGLGMMEQQAAAEMTKTEATVGDVRVLTFRANEPANLEMGLNVALVPGGVLIGTLTGDITSILENMQNKAPALGATEAYTATSRHLNTQGAEIESFVRLDPMMDFGVAMLRLGKQMSEELAVVDVDGVERALDAMGWRKLGCAGGTANYVDGKCVAREFHASGGQDAAASAVDMAFLKWVPKDAVSFSAMRLDIAGIYDMLLTGLKAYDENFAKQMLEQLAQMETQLGFNVRDDFFGSFGDHLITWAMPMSTISSMPEMAVLLKVTDEQKIVKVLKNLAKLTDGMVEIEEGEKRGLKAYQVRVNFDPTQGMGVNPLDMLQPTFAFKNGYLVLGFSVSDVKRTFQRMDREDDPKGDIRGNKEYAAVAEQLPKALQSVSFTDWKAQFESYCQMATGLLAFVPMGEDVPIDMSLLPDSGTLTKHLFGSLSYSAAVEGGTESTTVSPFGPETVLMLGIVVGGAVATFVVMSRGF